MAGLSLVRKAIPTDLDAMIAIENSSFSDPWSYSSLAESLETGNSLTLVLEQSGVLAGYLVIHWVGVTAEILNLAVAANFRRMGVGRALLREGFQFLEDRRIQEVFLEVRPSNVAARELYGSFGFRVVGIRAKYYQSPVEDAMVMKVEAPLSA